MYVWMDAYKTDLTCWGKRDSKLELKYLTTLWLTKGHNVCSNVCLVRK